MISQSFLSPLYSVLLLFFVLFFCLFFSYCFSVNNICLDINSNLALEDLHFTVKDTEEPAGLWGFVLFASSLLFVASLLLPEYQLDDGLCQQLRLWSVSRSRRCECLIEPASMFGRRQRECFGFDFRRPAGSSASFLLLLLLVLFFVHMLVILPY